MVALRTTVGRPPPRNLELELRRALRPMVDRVRATVGSGRIKNLGDVTAMMVALRKAWPNKRIRAIVAKIGRAAEGAASRPWGPVERTIAAARERKREKGDAAEHDGAALVEAWSRKAAELITSVRDEVGEGLRRDIVRALEAGTDPAELAATWKRQGIPVEFGTLEGRVRVIAQHQLASLHAEVGRARASAIGVTHFVWRSQRDSRVRERHRELDGQRFAYKNPPSDEGLPGQPVNCRCWAESVIPDELLASLGIEPLIER